MKGIAALLATVALALPASADAAEKSPNDRFVAGGSVQQTEPVSGDLVGFGGDFDLAAVVVGDAVLAGGNVRIRESVAQDLYAAGGNVRVDGSVGRSARLAGGNVELTANGKVAGNLSVAGGTVNIRGPVGGTIDAAAGDVLIDAEVGGDVRVAGGSVELGPNARIAGRLQYGAFADVKRDPGAQVAGGIERRAPRRQDVRERASYRGFAGGWIWSVGLIALAALIAAAFPGAATRIGQAVRREPALALFLGFVVLVCVPVAAVLLGITIVGIPLAMILMLLYVLLLLVGYASAGVMIGDAALARLRSQDAARTAWRVGAAALAALALAVLGRLPYVGWIVAVAALLAGIGAIVITISDRRAAAAAA